MWRGGDDMNMGKGIKERERGMEGNRKDEGVVKPKVYEKRKMERVIARGTTEKDCFSSKCGVMAELIALSQG